jgi:hypothetical protein
VICAIDLASLREALARWTANNEIDPRAAEQLIKMLRAELGQVANEGVRDVGVVRPESINGRFVEVYGC